MTPELQPDPGAASSELSRRGVFRGVAVAGIAGSVLAACGSDDEPSTGAVSAPSSDASDGSAGSDGSGGSSGGAGGGKPLTSTSDVPSGGGIVLPDQKVVVTQPTDGDFKAFSAICPHQGCLVSEVIDKEITCFCHGSQFSIEDGSVDGGPSTQPLAPVAITVTGDQISLS